MSPGSFWVISCYFRLDIGPILHSSKSPFSYFLHLGSEWEKWVLWEWTNNWEYICMHIWELSLKNVCFQEDLGKLSIPSFISIWRKELVGGDGVCLVKQRPHRQQRGNCYELCYNVLEESFNDNRAARKKGHYIIKSIQNCIWGWINGSLVIFHINTRLEHKHNSLDNDYMSTYSSFSRTGRGKRALYLFVPFISYYCVSCCLQRRENEERHHHQ